MRDPDRNGSEEARGPLECQAAGAVLEEIAYPLDQVWADPLSAEEREEGGRLYIVEASLDIEEESGDFVLEAVKRLNIVL